MTFVPKPRNDVFRFVWPTTPLKIDLHVHIHTDTPPPPVRTASRAVLMYQGVPMSDVALTVDSVNKKVTLAYTDDKGDTTPTPTGATVAFASDNPAVLTVAPDATDPMSGDITVVAEGTANISATQTGALEADGVTPIPDPAPAAVTVGPGPANSATLTVA